MKQLAVLSCTILFCFSAHAQSYQWAKSNGGFDDDRAFGVTRDASGNTFVTGQLSGTVNFNTFTLQANYGDKDIFVVKYDSSGNAVWGFAAGSMNEDGGYAIGTDAQGNVYVAGTFIGTAVFGNDTLNSAQGYDNDAFLLKLDANGNEQWVRRGGGDGYDAARGLCVSGNHVYMCGGAVVPATFGSQTLTGYGSQDAFVAAYQTDGTFDWAQAYGGAFADLAYAIASDSNQNLYTTGYFIDTATFGAYTLVDQSVDNTDVFVMKTDSTGVPLWAHRGGYANNDDMGRGIAVDGSANVFVTGDFNNVANFDGQAVISSGGADVFLAKYNTSGAIQYVKRFGGVNDDRGYGVSVSDTSVYAIGSFNATATFGNFSLASNGGTDAFIAWLGASGAVHGVLRGGGSGDDAGRSISANNSGTSVAGDFEGASAAFGSFMLTAIGVHDYFAAALMPFSITPCAITATVTPSNPIFCPNTFGTLATQVYGSYQWYKDGVLIPGATNQTYSVDVNNEAGSHFNVAVMLNGCSDTSAAVLVDAYVFLPIAIQQSNVGWFDGQYLNMCQGDTLLLTLLPPYDINVQWYKNGASIPGANAINYNVTQSGNYTVSAAPTQCSIYNQTLGVSLDVHVHPTVATQITQSHDTLFAHPDTLAFQWYLNGNVISGATNTWYVSTTPGSYSVTTTDSTQCGLPSTPFVITDVLELNNASLQVYPNPVADVLHVSLNKPMRYKLFDSQGRWLRDGVVTNLVDVSDLPNGNYTLSLTDAKVAVNKGFSVLRQ